jgi:hypothetical protein
MKKIITAAFISTLLLTTASAQSISKKEARDFLEKAWRCVITSDSTTFIQLWENENSAKQKLMKEFIFIREFLDTALTRNLAIDDVEIEKHNLKDTDAEIWIKAWFKYDAHYYKGFEFYVANKDNRWVVRGSTSTSARSKN